MSDKVQKIREEVEMLQNELIQEKEKSYDSDVDDACILELQNVLTYIDSLQEDPVSEDLEEASNNALNNVLNDHEIINIRSCLKMFRFGVEWQREQDKETIELAEDHAMLAGIIKGTEHTIGKVRSILNKVAYENNGLDVNGDYCEQPYDELDDKFRKLLKED